MACNKYLTHNSIDKTKEVLYPWIPLEKPKGALWRGRWKWSMPKTQYEKKIQLGFEMTLGKFEHYEERFTNFQKIFSLVFFNKNSPKHQISKPCGLF